MFGLPASHSIQRKMLAHFSSTALPDGIGTAAATAFGSCKRECTTNERTEVNDGTAQLYPDVEAVQRQGKNILYLRPQAAGTPLRHLLYKGRYDLLERSCEGVSGGVSAFHGKGKMYRGTGAIRRCILPDSRGETAFAAANTPAVWNSTQNLWYAGYNIFHETNIFPKTSFT